MKVKRQLYEQLAGFYSSGTDMVNPNVIWYSTLTTEKCRS